jgi:hypothetical protein
VLVAKQPLVAFSSSFGFLSSNLCFINRGFRGCSRVSSSSYIRTGADHSLSVSGGCVKENPVQITRKSPLVPATLHKLDQSCFLQEVQVALNSSDRPVQDSCQSLHLRPAQPGFVVGVICQRAVGWDCLSWDASCSQLLHLGNTGEFRFARQHSLLKAYAAVRSGMVEYPKAAVSPGKEIVPAAFSMLLSVRKSTNF